MNHSPNYSHCTVDLSGGGFVRSNLKQGKALTGGGRECSHAHRAKPMGSITVQVRWGSCFKLKEEEQE